MPEPGDRLGDFEILREIGRGTMGVVYEARQVSLARRAAVKVLAPAAAGDPVWTERFRHEASEAGRLSHPGILPVYAVGETGGLPWFAMELVEGRDLSGILAERRVLPPREAARIVLEAARALQHAHEHGVVHRDVKPGNLMVRDDGRVVVTDFGLAKHLGSGSLTATGLLVGTPYYMSPEQALGDRARVGPGSDVYGLGATLFEMLTGRPPFLGDDPIALLRSIAEREPPRPRAISAGVPPDLDTIALACLRKPPSERYASCAALADDLERFLRGASISRRPPGPLLRARGWLARHPVARGAALAMAVGVAGSVAFLVLRDRTGRASLDAEAQSARDAADEAHRAGDLERAAALLAAPLARDGLSPSRRGELVARLAGVTRARVRGALERGDPAGAVAVASELEAVRLSEEEREAVVPRAHLEVRARPDGADVLLAPAVGPTRRAGNPAGILALPLGLWRVEVSAPGRATIPTLVVLGREGASTRLDVSLPAADAVPVGSVAFGGRHVAWDPSLPPAPFPEVQPFLLDRTEVTLADYERFVAGAPASRRADLVPTSWSQGRPPPGSARRPATGVTWAMADAYAGAQGRRLPTAAEWGVAEPGGFPRPVPATGRPSPGGGRGRTNTIDHGAREALPVDRSDAFTQPVGTVDLVGNAAEWTCTALPGDPWRLLVVGGSFEDAASAAATARLPDETSPAVGFRTACALADVRPLPPAPPPLPGARRIDLTGDGAVHETLADGRTDEPPPLGEADVVVRQGSRHDLDLEAAAGCEVRWPAGAVIASVLPADATVGLRDGRLVTGVGPRPGGRLQVSAVVPAPVAPDEGVAAARAATEAAYAALCRLDAQGFLGWLDPAYGSDHFDDPEVARTVLALWSSTYARIDATSSPWSVDRHGDLVAVRRVLRRWDCVRRDGRPPDTPIVLPRVLVSWCRRDAASGAWRAVHEEFLPLAPRAGRVDADGAWRFPDLGVAVVAPYGVRVRPGPRGLADVDVFVDLPDAPDVVGEVFGHLRRDVGAGMPPLERPEWERYGYVVESERRRDVGGRTVVDATVTTREAVGGSWPATHRRTIVRGEGAVVVQVLARSVRSKEDALATLRSRAAAIERFLGAVVVEP